MLFFFLLLFVSLSLTNHLAISNFFSNFFLGLKAVKDS